MAIQTGQAKIYTTFKSSVFGLRIKSTDIFELGGSTNAITVTIQAIPFKIVRFQPNLTPSFTFNASPVKTVGFVNRSPLRTNSPSIDTFISNDDLSTAQDNFGLNLISRFSTNLRMPTRISIDLSKVAFAVSPSTSYTVSLSEDFFREETNNQMPSPAIDSLTVIAAPARPLITGYIPFNGQTDFRDNTKLILQVNVQDIPNALTRGAGFFRLYRNGVLVSSINVLDTAKCQLNGNKITLNVLGLIDAGRNYYVLIDNGVVASVDGFLSQSISSPTAIAFTTPASTDIEFPDLVALNVAGASINVPQTEILILQSASITATASLSSSAEKVYFGTGTSEVVASIITNVAKEVKPITTQPVLTNIFCDADAIKRAVSNMSVPTTLTANYIRIRNEAFPSVVSSLRLDVIELLTPGQANMFATSSLTAIGGSPLTMVFSVLSTEEFWSTGYGQIRRNTARTINIPVVGAYNVTINWGDGTSTITSGNAPNGTYITKQYSQGGTYTVQIFGEIQHLGKTFDPQDYRADDFFEGNTGTMFYYDGAPASSTFFQNIMVPGINQLTRVTSWGDLGFTSLRRAFSGAIRLTEVPARLPSTVTDISWMFDAAQAFNHANITQWNTSNVTYMRGVFYQHGGGGNGIFNQNISTWNTANVTNMAYMFVATSFNQSIGTWNTANVTDMRYMFSKSFFNQPIGTWNTSKVTNMKAMFSGNGQFNQSLNSWDVSKVTDFSEMFQGASIFNQPLNSWNTSSAITLESTFQAARVFNQNINSWNVSNVTNFRGTFAGTSLSTTQGFNQPLNSWDVSKGTDFSNMFQGSRAFNQPLNSWNTGMATDMRAMFQLASLFNQNIDSWNTSNVVNMGYMFNQATAFNQPLNSWNTGNVVDMRAMFAGATSFNQPLADWDTSKVGNVLSEFVGGFNAMNDMFNGATIFDQNISSWCVDWRTTKPTGFDTSTSTNWTTAEKPVWGTCPP